MTETITTTVQQPQPKTHQPYLKNYPISRENWSRKLEKRTSHRDFGALVSGTSVLKEQPWVFGAMRAMVFLLERPAIGERREYNRYGREEREI